MGAGGRAGARGSLRFGACAGGSRGLPAVGGSGQLAGTEAACRRLSVSGARSGRRARCLSRESGNVAENDGYPNSYVKLAHVSVYRVLYRLVNSMSILLMVQLVPLGFGYPSFSATFSSTLTKTSGESGCECCRRCEKPLPKVVGGWRANATATGKCLCLADCFLKVIHHA